MSNPNDHTQLCLEHYVNLGWSVILAHGVKPDPLTGGLMCTCWHGPTCSQPGKHPVYPWKDQPTLTLKRLLQRRAIYQQERTVKEDARVAQPNWALVLGRSALCSIDVDMHPGGADGQQSLAELAARFGPLPLTPRDNRGHWLFQLPDEAEANAWPTKIEMAPGVELLSGRSDADHLLYCAPSGHRDGTPYRWLDGASPWDVAVATLPDWIIERANKLAGDQPRPQVHAAGSSHSHTNGYYSPADDSAFERARAYLSRIPPAIAGQGGDNRTFYAACRVVVDFGVDFGQALGLLREWNAACSPPWKDRDIERFVKSAAARPGPRGRLRDRSHNSLDREFAHLRDVPLTIVRPCRRKHGERVPCMCPKCGPAAGAAGSDGAAECTLGDVLGGDKNLSVIDDIKRDEDAKAEEQQVARENARTLAEKENCKHKYGVLLASMTERADFILWMPCNKWSCEGCRAYFVRRWINNARFRLVTSASRPAHVFIGTCERADWRRLLDRAKKLRRNGTPCQFIRFSRNGGISFFVITNAPGLLEDEKEVGPDVACEKLMALLEAYQGPVAPISASKGWQLPKSRPQRVDRFEPLGKVSTDVGPNEAIEFADVTSVHMPAINPGNNGERRILNRMKFAYPPEWTEYQVDWFRYGLLHGWTPDGVEVGRVTGPPPREEPCEDRDGANIGLLDLAVG